MSEREEVTRYRIGWNHEQRNDFVTCEFGEFVRYDDYAALRSQLAALKPMVDLATKEGEGLLAVGNELLRLQRCLTTAERERDEARRELEEEKKLAALQEAWEGEAMADITALMKERNELRTRAESAERERDEARRERDVMESERDRALQEVEEAENEIHVLRHRAERAEAEAAYIRRAFRGAVESDPLAVTYKTVGSYRAGLLKTINALDTTEPTP